MIQSLLNALEEAVTDIDGLNVVFVDHVPNTFTAPSVVVAPSDPFMEPATHGHVREYWDVLVVYNPMSPDKGVGLFRELSLAVRDSAGSVGAVWERCSGPRSTDESTNHFLVVNRIYFLHDGS